MTSLLDDRQTTNVVMMVRPACFSYNPQTAASNTFQQRVRVPAGDVVSAVLGEFDAMVSGLRRHGITVMEFADTPEPPKPDAIFPNNWISFHADGTVVLYPMEAPNRRLERRDDLIEALAAEHGFRVARVLDLSGLERDGSFLEGTGSLVLDRQNLEAYAALSSRTRLDALADFSQRTGYRLTVFDTRDPGGRPVYHTNVMMSVGTGFAAVCTGIISDPNQRSDLLAHLERSGRQVIELTVAQLNDFAGNMLELRTAGGEGVIVLSRRALASLKPRQLSALGRFGRLLPMPVDTIEDVGGGSVRCMMAEVFLPGAEADHAGPAEQACR